MITIQLLGGMSNQMFQAAYGLALANRGYQVAFSKEHLMQEGHKVYSLDLFKIGKSIKFEKDPNVVQISEQGMPFNPELLKPPDPSVIFGYFQSEKYLEGIFRAVKFAFEPAQEPPADVLIIKHAIVNSNSVAMHVRRGDYLGLQHFHGMMPVDYYRRAADEIIDRDGQDHEAFVFSDDPDWCRANMPGKVISTGSKLWDLYLMSQCKHAIVANSSYSWWAAWMGDGKPGRVVVAPQQWFVDKNTDSRDIVPERWVRI